MNPAEVATAYNDIGVSIIFVFIILDLPFLVTIVHSDKSFLELLKSNL